MSAVPTASTGILRRTCNARYTSTKAQANSTSDSNILLNGARPAVTHRVIIYAVWARTPTASTAVVAAANRRRFSENKSAVASSSAAKYPARLRLNVHVICLFRDRFDLCHHRIGPFGNDGLTARQLVFARAHVLANDDFEVVHVVQV